MYKKYLEQMIPTKAVDFLDKLVNKKITKLIRYSWWNPETSAKECDIERCKVFSLTAGPLFIEFDTDIGVGFSSQPSTCSVEVWLEKDNENKRDELMCNDRELFPVYANDSVYSEKYFGDLIGGEFLKYEIIKKEPVNSLYWELPREVGIVFYFSNNSTIIVSHGLHDNSDDFSVIKNEQIDKNVIDLLYKTNRFWI